MLGAINNAFLHHESWGEKDAKILFHSFHSLFAMKNAATSTCVLTTRILAVEVSALRKKDIPPPSRTDSWAFSEFLN